MCTCMLPSAARRGGAPAKDCPMPGLPADKQLCAAGSPFQRCMQCYSFQQWALHPQKSCTEWALNLGGLAGSLRAVKSYGFVQRGDCLHDAMQRPQGVENVLPCCSGGHTLRLPDHHKHAWGTGCQRWQLQPAVGVKAVYVYTRLLFKLQMGQTAFAVARDHATRKLGSVMDGDP